MKSYVNISRPEFEVCLLTFDRVSSRDASTLYATKDAMNERHSERVFGEVVQRFIVLMTIRDVAYLAYKTSSLEEAVVFRKEAGTLFDAIRAAEKEKEVSRV